LQQHQLWVDLWPMLTAAPCLVQQQQWPAAQQDLQHLWQRPTRPAGPAATHTAARAAQQQPQPASSAGTPAAPLLPLRAQLTPGSAAQVQGVCWLPHRQVLQRRLPGGALGAAQAGMSGGAGLVSADGCSAGRDWQGSGSGYVSSSPGDLQRPTVAVMDRALVCSRLGLIQGGMYGIVEWRTESCFMLNY
jgi:hypothetical protein